MRLIIRKASCILSIIIILFICIQKVKIQDVKDDEASNMGCTQSEIQYLSKIEKNLNIDDKDSVYQANDGYKLFYGSWEYKKVVSQHMRLGGDEGFNNLLGKTVTYHSEYFEDSLGKINNPTYLISIYPINQNEYNQFFLEQIGIEELLPQRNYFVLIQIVNKSDELKTGLNGFTFIIKDNNTMYSFDNNCIYELARVGYIDYYDFDVEPTYQERW